MNCGFARTTIHQNSTSFQDGRYIKTIDKNKRALNFRSQFNMCTNYGIPERYFDDKFKDKTSLFERDCEKITKAFQSKWPHGSCIDRKRYLEKFSAANWSGLPTEEKLMHTMSRCAKCFECCSDFQRSFPLKPFYEHKVLVQVDTQAIHRQGVRKFTSKVLAEINNIYEHEVGTTFENALAEDASIGLESKKTRYEKKKEKRETARQYTKKVNQIFAQNAAINHLAEGESRAKYHRKRLQQSFETPENTKPPSKKAKTHSPKLDDVQWNKSEVENTIRNWPVNSEINWSAIARQHCVLGANGGQVVKEFAQSLGIDTSNFKSCTPSRKPRSRSCKKRLPGSSVSIPCNPPVCDIEREIKSMIHSGHFTLGEECAPYKITKYVPVQGKITPQEIVVMARKIPLAEIRLRLLKKQKQYMRLSSDSVIKSLPLTELIERLEKVGYKTQDKNHEELCTALATSERSRSLAMWHDHATILNMGFLMITVHTLYDPAVFLTDEEFKLQNNLPEAVCVQSEVEQPEIYILSLGGSSVEDQAAIIGDRLDCLPGLSIPIESEGIEMNDTLRFFTGDHPATQFEQGTKLGGHYKCGACGCRESTFDDQAHSLYLKLRSLNTLTTLAIKGVYGKQRGIVRPFDGLKVDELRRELRARGLDTTGNKDDLQTLLDETLKGVASVPALLLTNPIQSLSSLNLSNYEVVASEPLHDIKGHIINLLTELPHILPEGEETAECKHLIKISLAKKKKVGADMRRVIIQVYLMLKETNCREELKSLLQTIVTISEILYSKDAVRSPRKLLKLYNSCWLHMELCAQLFQTPKKISRTKFFGHYLHALTAHSPDQYELVCQRSINAENQERFFGQARIIAETCTNHHASNVIPQVLLRLQAKQEHKHAFHSLQKADSQVKQIAKHLPSAQNTHIKRCFIRTRKAKWQMHLYRISPFLELGRGVWWIHSTDGFVFLDGDSEPSQYDSPSMLHFRHHTIDSVIKRREKCWNDIVDKKIPLPAVKIKVYDENGTINGHLSYTADDSVTFHARGSDNNSIISRHTQNAHSLNGPPSLSVQNGPPSPSDHNGLSLSDHNSLSLCVQNGPPSLSVQNGPPSPSDHNGLSLSDHNSLSLCVQNGPPSLSVQNGPPSPSDHNGPQFLCSENIQSFDTEPTDIAQPLDGAQSLSNENTTDKARPDQGSYFTKENTHNSERDNLTTTSSDNQTNPDIPYAVIDVSPEEPEGNGFKTSLATSVSKVLGNTPTVKEFDQLRFDLKRQSNNLHDRGTKHKIMQYQQTTANLGSQLLAKRSRLDRDVNALEKTFFDQHGTLPDHNNDHYKKLLSQRNCVKTIIRYLNIKL